MFELRFGALRGRHLQVEVSLERVVDVDEGAAVRPAQLSTRCGDNCFIRESLGKAQHVAQVFLGEAPAVVGLQLSHHCRDNLLAVSGTLALEH